MKWWDKPLGLRADLYIGCLSIGGASWLLGEAIGMSLSDRVLFTLLVVSGVGLISNFLRKANDAG